MALAFALYTNHVWEDYYITFRASKNLATGHGLVFNVGDRLHTFTSPVGVLLPAAASWMAGPDGDAVALWLFRLISIAAYGGAAWLMVRLANLKSFGVGLLVLTAVGFILDAKSVDFVINGMETGLLLFFLAAQFYALFKPGEMRWLYLGIAWAGLMWTRPDGFLYIGLLAVGTLVFNRHESTGQDRRALLVTFFKAALLCTALYLPWFVGAWLYYGTPVPHTITAKQAVSNPPVGWLATAQSLLNLPLKSWGQRSVFDDVFTASYSAMGWPAWLTWFSRVLALSGSLLWLVPRIRTEAKAASLAAFGFLFYLNTFTSFAYPWYLPGPAWLVWAAWAFAAFQLAQWFDKKGFRRGAFVVLVGFALIVVARGWLLYEVALGVRQEQRLVNDGVRQPMGEWLRKVSRPGDTVFMESLGYVGYYSNLKTYDYPGMSSREVPQLIKSLGTDWGVLIDYFCPDWVILRPAELDFVQHSVPLLLTERYEEIRRFKVPAESMTDYDLLMPFAKFDSEFIVYRRKTPPTRRLKVADWSQLDSAMSLDRNFYGHAGFGVHATSIVSFVVPKGAKRISGMFRMDPMAKVATKDGVAFHVYWRHGNKGVGLSADYLNPAVNPADRRVGSYECELPASGGEDAEILLIASHVENADGDWVEWSVPRFD